MQLLSLCARLISLNTVISSSTHLVTDGHYCPLCFSARLSVVMWWMLASFHFLAIAAVHIGVETSLWHTGPPPLDIHPAMRAGPYGASIFSFFFFRTFRLVLQNGNTNLHSQQHWERASSSHSVTARSHGDTLIAHIRFHLCFLGAGGIEHCALARRLFRHVYCTFFIRLASAVIWIPSI